MPKLLEHTNLLKDLDIYECPCPCEECTGAFLGLGLRFRCLCGCHHKQFPTRRDLGITDNAVPTDIKIDEPYIAYTVHTNRRYSKDGNIGEQRSDVLPLSIQNLETMR